MKTNITLNSFSCKFFSILISIILLFCLIHSNTFAQAVPTNDNCSGALLLTPNQACTPINGTSANATQSMLACGAGGIADDDVWFKFVATRNQHAIKVSGSAGYDAVVEVFSGSCSNLNSLSCTDATSNGQLEMTQPGNLTVGATYYVRVYHYKSGSGTGTFTICISDPNNDFCDGATELIPGNGCTPEIGNLINATQSLPICGAGSGTASDVWYQFTATGLAHDVTVTPTASFGMAMEVFSGSSCNSLNSLKCQTAISAGGHTMELAPLVAGQTYYVRVYTTATVTTSRPFTICVKNHALTAGSVCDNAVNIPAIPFNSGTQTTCGKGDFYRGDFLNNRITGEEMVFKLDVTNAPVSYLLKLDRLNAAAAKLAVSVFQGCPSPPQSPGNFVGDSPMNLDSSTITLKTNGTYYFLVDQFATSNPCGSFKLSILPIPNPPVNDECINAISLTVGKTCVPHNGSSAYATQSLPGVPFPVSLNYPTVADDDVWFSFVAKSTKHKIVLDSDGAFDYAGVMELFSGSCGNLTSMQGLYNSGGNIFDINATNLVVGQTYYVRVYHRLVGWSSGRFTICVSEYIANDECTGAINLAVQPANVTPVLLFATTAVATQSLPACTPNSGNNFANDDVWFKFTATTAYQFIKVNGLDKDGQVGQFNFMPSMELFAGSCTGLNSLVCANHDRWMNKGEIHTTNLTPGTTYYLRVYEAGKNIYDDKFTIYVQEELPPVPGAVCSNAIPITALPYNSGTQTTCGAGSDYNSACSSGGNNYQDLVFKLNITNAPVTYNIGLTSTTTVKTFAVFNGCPSPVDGPNNCVNGRYLSMGSYGAHTLIGDKDSTVNDVFTFTANGTYYIVVEDYVDVVSEFSGQCGTFKLTVKTITAPVNDLCADAILLTSGLACVPVAGTSAGATSTNINSTCNQTFYDDEVWYKFVATTPNHTITVNGLAGYWPGAQLFTGNCPGVTALTCDEAENPDGIKTLFAENLQIGKTYYVQVFDQRHSYGVTGNFTICLTNGISRPAGSTCTDAVLIPSVPYNSGLQTTCGKGNDYGYFGFNTSTYLGKPAYYGFGEDMVFRLNITNAPVTYNVTLSAPDGWKILRIYKDCPIELFGSPFLAMATGPDTAASANYTFTSNGSYYIVTDKWTEPGDPVCAPFRLKVEPAAYPVNNECTAAIQLPVTATCTPTKGNISLATKSQLTACYDNRDKPDVWYKFTAPASRNVTISVKANNTVWPLVELFRDTCGALTSMGCPDWNGDSTITLNFYKLNTGETYHFRVQNNISTTSGNGDFEVCVTSIPFVANSICAGAQTLAVSAPNVCNAVNGTTTGSFAVPNLPGCSGTADDNAWYKFTATQPAHRVQVKGSIGFDPVVEIFTGTCTNPSSLACTDNTAMAATENLDVNGLTVGQTYLVRVYHQDLQYGSGKFTICVQERPQPPVNDFCDNALNLPADTTCTPVAGTVMHATQSLQGCSGTAATDVWYKFTALGPENTIFVTNSGDADLVVELLSNSCQVPNSLICRDTAIAAGNETIRFAAATVGQTYYVRVYAYNSEFTNGDFTICVKSNSVRSVIPLPPALSIFCAAEQFKLPFQVFGSFNASNVFQAQLSDSAGSFANPVLVGTTATAVSDTITVTLPPGSKKSNLYRIRIVATAPAYTSPVFMPLSINAIPNPPQFTIPPQYCSGETVAALQANGANVRWYSDNQLKNLVKTGNSFTPPALTDTTNYYITQTTTGCESQPVVMTVIVKSRPNTFFAGLDSVYCASTQPVMLTPAVLGGTFSGSLVFGNTFIPALSGNHTITYTLTRTGCTATETRKVTVKPSPPALTGNSQTICSGNTVQIGLPPNVNFSYAWTPVTGISNPNIANPTFTGINLTGQNDTVVRVLQVTDLVNGCTSTSYLKIVVKGVAPISLSSSQAICSDRPPFQLSASPLGGIWTGNGVTTTGIFNPILAGTGTHKLKYTLQQNGCSRADSMFITVTPTPVATAGPDAVICAGTSVTLGSPAIAGYTYQWTPSSYLDNPAAAMPIFYNNSVTTSTTFTKTLTVTNTVSGCTATSQVQITVKPLPVVNAGPDVTICKNAAPFQLTPTPSGGNWTGSIAINGNSFNPAIATIGTHHLAYNFTQNGCAVSDSLKVTILPSPVAAAGPDALICSDGTIVLGIAAQPSVSYVWNPATGLNNAFSAQPTFSLSNHSVSNLTEVKTLTVTNLQTGCTSTDTVEIIVKPMPLVNAGNDVTLCTNSGLYQLTATPAGGSWTGNPFINGSTFDPAIAGPGIYSLVYNYSLNSCFVTDTLKVTVKLNPNAFAGSDTTICSGETILLGSQPKPGNIYNWVPATGLSDPNISNPTFTFQNQTTKTEKLVKILSVTDFVTGCNSVDTVTIMIKPLPQIKLGADTTLCIVSGTHKLKASPIGGTWSGSNGITGMNFDPIKSGPGNHQLTYSYNLNGCITTKSKQVTVLAVPAKPIINLINLDSLGSSVTGTAYQWLFNGNPLNVNAPGLTPAKEGWYQVIVWNGSCVSDTSAAYNFKTVVLQIPVEGLNLYPNPSPGKSRIVFRQAGTKSVILKLHDATGRLVLQRQYLASDEGAISDELDLSGLHNGMYFLELNNGLHTWYRKLILEK